jgi:trigger factor
MFERGKRLMKVSSEVLETNVVQLDVEVDAAQVDQALDQAFKVVSMKVNVPGFRKGKVPRAIFESKFGVESLYNEAMEKLLPVAYRQAIDESGIVPVDQPDVDVIQFGKGQSLIFKAKVVVKPEVKLGVYKGLDVEVPATTVSEEELTEELTRLQNRHAELSVVEDGAVAQGDFAIIDFEGFIEDVPFPGGKGEKHSLEIGSNSFIPGFEDQVVGMVKDEERDIKVTFPESYHSDEVAGKDALFKVKLHEIKRKVLPALDDEFAKDVSDFETIEEFKADLQTRMLQTKTKQAENELESKIVEKAAANAQVEIPAVMIEQEIDNMYAGFERRLSQQNLNAELYFQFTGQTEQSVREQMKENADQAVLHRLVLEAIAKTEEIVATEEEITEEIEKLAQQHSMTTDDVRDALVQNGSLLSLAQDIVFNKTIKLLIDNNKPKKSRKKAATAE